MNAMTLNQLPVGAQARLIEIGGERGFRRRLLELGLLPGTTLRLIRRADIGGLLELEARGARLTLRLAEAATLRVEQAG